MEACKTPVLTQSYGGKIFYTSAEDNFLKSKKNGREAVSFFPDNEFYLTDIDTTRDTTIEHGALIIRTHSDTTTTIIGTQTAGHFVKVDANGDYLIQFDDAKKSVVPWKYDKGTNHWVIHSFLKHDKKKNVDWLMVKTGSHSLFLSPDIKPGVALKISTGRENNTEYKEENLKGKTAGSTTFEDDTKKVDNKSDDEETDGDGNPIIKISRKVLASGATEFDWNDIPGATNYALIVWQGPNEGPPHSTPGSNLVINLSKIPTARKVVVNAYNGTTLLASTAFNW